jgi:catechol 2,3-dioxygenase-like lactoylglutathione lyase family enzyme
MSSGRTALLLACWAAGACTPRPAEPPHEAARPRIFAIAGASFLVSDLAKARAFWGDFLGFPWRVDGGAAIVAINARQSIELRAGAAGPGGRLDHVAFAGSGPARLIDPDQHALTIVPGAPPSPGARRAAFEEGRIATHIAHVGLLAAGLAASLRFYRDALGFHETWRGSATGGALDWVNLAVPDGDDYVELMLYQERPAPEQSGGKNHVCLFTPDLARSVALLEARPARRDYPRPIEMKVGRNRKRQANLFDPDGTRVELMEPFTVDGQPPPPSDAAPPHP